MALLLSLLLWSCDGFAKRVDPRESLKEVCFGRKDPRCSTVSRHKITRRKRGKIVTTKKLSAKQYAAAKRAIEMFQASAANHTDCQEPVEIADFVGESLVRVQAYCGTTTAVQSLKKRL